MVRRQTLSNWHFTEINGKNITGLSEMYCKHERNQSRIFDEHLSVFIRFI